MANKDGNGGQWSRPLYFKLCRKNSCQMSLPNNIINFLVLAIWLLIFTYKSLANDGTIILIDIKSWTTTSCFELFHCCSCWAADNLTNVKNSTCEHGQFIYIWVEHELYNCNSFPINSNKTLQPHEFSTVNNLHYTV